MHLSQRNTPSSPYSPNLPHTLNLNQVEHHVGYCPCCIFNQKQFLTLSEDLNWIEFLLTLPQPPLQVDCGDHYTNVSIPAVERPWLSEAEGFKLPNHDTGRILPDESQVKSIDPLVNITDSSVTDYDSADEASVCSISLPPLKKLAGAKPVSGPKTIKSIMKSNSTFKAETLKGVTINEPTSAPAKSNKNVSASKRNSAPAGKLKNVKTEDDILLFVVMKELGSQITNQQKSVILLQK
ncbi:hypothetical protein Tco_0156128 [Tanacetum coccineum]